MAISGTIFLIRRKISGTGRWLYFNADFGSAVFYYQPFSLSQRVNFFVKTMRDRSIRISGMMSIRAPMPF